ncbi:NmrA family protein [Hypoxylon sp. FL1284]|nr:NmrA family protein [Hypoxylon sp. FL1284]
MGIGKVVIFGATSPTGQAVVQRALELGWKVTVHGRRKLPEHAANADITTFESPLDDEPTLRAAIAGQDVVISLLGPSTRHPYADASGLAAGYRHIFSAMRASGVRRILALSTYSVYDAGRDRRSAARWALVATVRVAAGGARRAVLDVARAFDDDAAGLDWTLFRVGFLADGPRMRAVDGYVGDGTLGMYVRRADVAEWALRQAEREAPEHVREKPGICSLK